MTRDESGSGQTTIPKRGHTLFPLLVGGVVMTITDEKAAYYARQCSWLAETVDTPELRECFLQMTRRWMELTMREAEGGCAEAFRR
jgi:hypothetical protein